MIGEALAYSVEALSNFEVSMSHFKTADGKPAHDFSVGDIRLFVSIGMLPSFMAPAE